MAQQLDVVELGRRRRWSEEENLRTVMESLEAPRPVSPTARRYGISRSLPMAWRRALNVERVAADPAPAFGPAVVVPETVPEVRPVTRRARRQAGQGRMVIEAGRSRQNVAGPRAKPFPAHLPRVRVVVPGPSACPCCIA